MNSKLINKKQRQLEMAIEAEKHAAAIREEAERLHEAVEAASELQGKFTNISLKLSDHSNGGVHPDELKSFFRGLGNLLGACKQDELQMVLVQLFNGYISKKVPFE